MAKKKLRNDPEIRTIEGINLRLAELYAEIEKLQNIKRLRILPYEEYLETPHWKNVRGQALKRANYKCLVCGAKQNLNVHHKHYATLGFESPIKDLEVLCQDCHQRHHEEEERIKAGGLPYHKVGKVYVPRPQTSKKVRVIKKTG